MICVKYIAIIKPVDGKGYFRLQGIIRHAVYPVLPEYSGISTRRIKVTGCYHFENQLLQNILSKFVHCKNNENFKLKLCTCAQSHAFGTHTKCQLEIIIIMWFLTLYIFTRLLWRARETLMKQPPGHSHRLGSPRWHIATGCHKLCWHNSPVPQWFFP